VNSDHNQRKVRGEAPASDAKDGARQARSGIEKCGFGIGTARTGVTLQEG
jgi:hypothetical protein